MKRMVAICFLVGFAFVFLTGKPTKAWACGTCEAAACVFYGDIWCTGGQYTYPATPEEEGDLTCSRGLPTGCDSGTGNYDVMFVDQRAMCGDDCHCQFNPTEWDVYVPCS